MTASGVGRLLARKPGVLALVDLVQDIDVILPVLVALRDSRVVTLKIILSSWLDRESPRTAALLAAHGLSFRTERRARLVDGIAPGLRGISAVLTASESSHPAHRAGHALAARAKALGLKTYTLQHGLENIGLCGVDMDAARFASDVVFCWFSQSQTPVGLAGETRGKLDHVGRPAPSGGWSTLASPAFDLAIYENLHWERYAEADRDRFLAGLRAVVETLPELRVVVRPHPAGGWGERIRHEFAQFCGLTVQGGAEARQSLLNTAQSPATAARVITTPSTVALDAALAGRAVALAVGGGSIYTPLQVLEGPEDWLAFAQSDNAMAAELNDFKRRVVVEDGAVDRIVERMCRDLGVQSQVNLARPQ